MEKKEVQAKTQMLKTGSYTEQGFTLMEVLIVITIIALTLGITLPSFNNISNSIKLKLEKYMIINVFNQARKKAVISNNENSVLIKNNSISLKLNGENKITSKLKILKLKKGQEKLINYFPNGTSNGGKINFVTDNNQLYTLEIDNVTGEVYWGKENE